MITIKGRKLIIPSTDTFIGFEGDNKVNTIIFSLSDLTLSEFDFKLDIKSNNEVGIVDLVKTIEDNQIILTWEVLKEHIPNGILYMQLRAFNGNEQVWHSEIGHLRVGNSINATDYFPPELPSEFEQMEQRVTQAKNDTITAKNIVVEKANEVATNTQTVNEKTAIVMEKAAEVEENTAEVEENTEIAETSANTAAQALADLLAMLGTDIATLTDGKLTPSQIPPISINDVFEVADTTAMLSLTAQRGDVALIVPDNTVEDSYILAADNPAVLSNWKKLGVSFVANAGHSLTADEAVNATKINGHGLVRFDTIEELENAVKVEGTLYYAPYSEE